MEHCYYISVGSNVADAEKHVDAAFAYLQTILGNFRSSSIYSTAPMGGKPGSDYTNAVACGTTPLSADNLNRLLKEYERSCGRTKAMSEAGHIIIDLDIVTVDDEVVRERDFNAEYFTIGYLQLHH